MCCTWTREDASSLLHAGHDPCTHHQNERLHSKRGKTAAAAVKIADVKTDVLKDLEIKTVFRNDFYLHSASSYEAELFNSRRKWNRGVFLILCRLLRVKRMQEIPADSLEMTPRLQQPIRARRCSLETQHR